MIRHKYYLETFFKENNLSYYLLGVFYSDGNVRVLPGNKGRAQIGSKDYDWLVDINNYISPEKPIEKGRTCYLATYNSIEITNWLITHGCIPNKSLTLEIPPIPEKYIPDFIRGCWDGDGTLGIYRRMSKTQGYETTRVSCSICSGSKKFIEQFKNLLAKLDIKSNIQTRKLRIRKIENRIINSENHLYVLNVTGKENIGKFCQTIYYNNNEISLKRKEEVSLKLKEYCAPKLNNEQIVHIQNGNETAKELSKLYNISTRTVSRIRSRALKPNDKISSK